MRSTPMRMPRGMCNDRPDPQDLDFSLTFTDSFLGRRRRLALGTKGNPLPPPDQRVQIMRPLEFIKTAAWFFALHSQGMKRHREEPPPPLGYMLTEFSPCVPVRVMCGCVATVCRRLATAPTGVHVIYRTTGRWAAWIMERVTRGRVRRVQVRGYPPAARLLSRAGLLTRIAANAG
jgi:hypothetical protein